MPSKVDECDVEFRGNCKNIDSGKCLILACAKGFIAQWIINYLLKEHYEIVENVRNQDKRENFLKQFNYPKNLALEIFRDIGSPGTSGHGLEKEAKKSIWFYAIHQRQTGTLAKNEEDLLNFALNGTKGIFDCVKKYEAFNGIHRGNHAEN